MIHGLFGLFTCMSHRNEVFIMSEEGLKLGRGVYLSHSMLTICLLHLYMVHPIHCFLEDEVFGKVMLLGNYSDEADDINLPMAVDQKVLFHQLEVNYMLIYTCVLSMFAGI